MKKIFLLLLGAIAIATIAAVSTTVTYFNLIGTAEGTATAVSYGFRLDPDTGMFRSATNVIGFATGGTEQWVINSSGALNPVGVSNDIGNGSANPRDVNVTRDVNVSSGTNTITLDGDTGLITAGNYGSGVAPFKFGLMTNQVTITANLTNSIPINLGGTNYYLLIANEPVP